MSLAKRQFCLVCLLLSASCGDPDSQPAKPSDAKWVDAQESDEGYGNDAGEGTDAGAGDVVADGGAADIATADGGAADIATADGGAADIATADGGAADLLSLDSSPADVSASDNGASDTQDVSGDTFDASTDDSVGSGLQDVVGDGFGGPGDAISSDTTAPTGADILMAGDGDGDGGAAPSGDGATFDSANSLDGGATLPPKPLTCPKPDPTAGFAWKKTPLYGAAVPAISCAKKGWLGQPATGKLVFADVTATVVAKIPQFVSRCLAVADFDGDGDLDIVTTTLPQTLAGKTSLVFLRNQLVPSGKLGFVVKKTPVVGAEKFAQCTTVDIDGDGDLDVLAAAFPHVVVFRNTKGSLSLHKLSLPKSAQRETASVAALDYDLDGDLDLISAPMVSAKLPMNPNDPCICKPASDPPYTHCGSGFCKPVHNDLLLLRNDGNLVFSHVATLPKVTGDNWSLSVHDLDRDGWPDVFVGNEWGNHAWLRNDSGGGFTAQGTALGLRPYAHIMGSAMADFDGDGHMDLMVSDYGADTLYTGKTGGLFSNGSKDAAVWSTGPTAVTWATLAADMNFDGWQDVLMSASIVLTPQTLHTAVTFGSHKHTPGTGHLVRRNVGGKFVAQWLPWPTGSKPIVHPNGWAAGDLDGDGDIDVVSTSFPHTFAIYRNDTPGLGNWLGLRFKSKSSAPFGEGAWVFVSAKGHVQQRYIARSSGLSADGPYNSQFGLGAANKVDWVLVRWPSGKTSLLWPSKLNTWHTVTEP